MADNSVFISGASSGAFLEAFEGLPDWATEDTAKSIEGILKKSLGIHTKALSQMMKCCGNNAAGKALSPGDAKKLNDELAKTIKHFRDLNKEMDKRKKRAKEEDADINRRTKLREKEHEVDSARISLGAQLIALGEKVKGAMISNVNIFDELYAAGINVVSGFDSASDGFQALQQLSAITGVRFTELAKTMEKYSTAVNTFGVEKFARTVAKASTELGRFGYGTKEVGELLGAYLESQRSFNDVNSRTQEEVQKDLIKFGERITKLSTATGIARAQLLANNDALAKSVDATLLAIKIGDKAADSTINFISALKDQKLGQAILRLMTDTIKPLNATFMDLQKTGFGGFAMKFQRFTASLEGVEDPEEKARLTAEFAKANNAELRRMQTQGRLLEQSGMAEGGRIQELSASLMRLGRDYKAVSKAERDKLEATAAANKAFKNAWENLLAQFQITFAPLPKILEMFTKGIVWLNEGFAKIRSWVGDVETFINSFKAITDVTGEINLLPWIGVGLAGLSALAGIKMAFGILKYALGMFAIKTTTLVSGIDKISKVVKWIGAKLSTVGSLLLSAGRFIVNALKPVGAVIMRLAPMLLRLLGPVALLYTAFQLGSSIGETLYETLSEFEWFNTAMENTFSFIEGIGPAISTKIEAAGVFFSNAGKKVSESLDSAGNWVSGKIKAAGEVFSAGSNLIPGLFENTVDTVSTGMLATSNFISNGYKSLMNAVGPKTRNVINSFYDGVVAIKNVFVNIFKNLFTFIGEKFTKWFPWISDVTEFLSYIPNKIKDIFNNMKLFGESYVDALKEFLITVMKKFSDKMIPDFMKFWKSSEPEKSQVNKADKTGTAELAKAMSDIVQSYSRIGVDRAEVDKIIKSLQGNNPNAEIDKIAKSLEGKVSQSEIDKLLRSLQEVATSFKSQENKDQKKVEPQTTKINSVVSLPDLKTTAGTSRLTNPKPSELNSPSEISTKPPGEKPGPVDAKKADIASGVGLRKENNGPDINTVIGYQTSVLEQILQSTNSLVSVNQDILKYTRVQS